MKVPFGEQQQKIYPHRKKNMNATATYSDPACLAASYSLQMNIFVNLIY